MWQACNNMQQSEAKHWFLSTGLLHSERRSAIASPMNRVVKVSMVTVAALGAALFAMAPASGAPEKAGKFKIHSQSTASEMGYFTPAASDPRLAAAFARGGLNNQGFRFTPVGANRNRAVTVAVRANGAAKGLVMRDAPQISSLSSAAPTLGVQPVSYSLGAAVGWKKFALTGEAERLDIGTLSQGTEKTSAAIGNTAKKWSSRVQVSAERPLGQAPRTLTGSESLALDVGGAFRLTRNLDVTAGVRYKSERDRLQQVDDRRDSQAVYVGTAFRF